VNLSLNNQTSLHLESFEGSSVVEKEFPVVISCINFPSFRGELLPGRYVPTPDISEVAKESPYLRVMIWQVSLCVGTLNVYQSSIVLICDIVQCLQTLLFWSYGGNMMWCYSCVNSHSTKLGTCGMPTMKISL